MVRIPASRQLINEQRSKTCKRQILAEIEAIDLNARGR